MRIVNNLILKIKQSLCNCDEVVFIRNYNVKEQHKYKARSLFECRKCHKEFKGKQALKPSPNTISFSHNFTPTGRTITYIIDYKK